MSDNTSIETLMAEYTEDGCDFSNKEWVRKAALRYVETMQDSQVRCLLYMLALDSGIPNGWRVEKGFNDALLVCGNGKKIEIVRGEALHAFFREFLKD